MSREGCDGLFHTFRGPIRDGDSCVCGKTTYPPAPEPVSRAGDGTNDPWYDALDRAAMYYRRELRHIIEECGNDEPRIDHIREAAERAIRAADHELAALASPEART